MSPQAQQLDPAPGRFAGDRTRPRILGLGHRRRRIAVRRDVSRRETFLLGALGIVVLLAAWQIAASAGLINPLAASSPAEVWRAAKQLVSDGTLGPRVASSAVLFGAGFGLSVVVGLVVGMILGWYRRLNAFLDPWVSLLYATPRLALIPLVVVWIGVGFTARVVVVFTIAVFPIIINVAAGVNAIERDHLQVARSFLATNKDVLMTIALPGAIPSIVSGIRQGMILSLIGVVVAEYFIGSTGVGGLIFQAGLTLQTAQAFVGALVFALAALALTVLLQMLERRLDRWRTT